MVEFISGGEIANPKMNFIFVETKNTNSMNILWKVFLSLILFIEWFSHNLFVKSKSVFSLMPSFETIFRLGWVIF